MLLLSRLAAKVGSAFLPILQCHCVSAANRLVCTRTQSFSPQPYSCVFLMKTNPPSHCLSSSAPVLKENRERKFKNFEKRFNLKKYIFIIFSTNTKQWRGGCNMCFLSSLWPIWLLQRFFVNPSQCNPHITWANLCICSTTAANRAPTLSSIRLCM